MVDDGGEEMHDTDVSVDCWSDFRVEDFDGDMSCRDMFGRLFY